MPCRTTITTALGREALARGVANAGLIGIGTSAVARAAATIGNTTGDAGAIWYALANATEALLLRTWTGSGAHATAAICVSAGSAIALRSTNAHARTAGFAVGAIAVARSSAAIGLATRLPCTVGNARLAVAKDADLGIGAIAAFAGINAVAVYANRSGVAGNVGTGIHIA